MISAILSSALFSIGFIVGLYVYAQLLLPLFYGLPKSLYLFFKGEVRFFAVISQLITPLIWAIFFIILGFVIQITAPSVNRFIQTNTPLNLGGWFAIIVLVINCFTSKGRTDLRADYLKNTYTRYAVIDS